MSLQAIPIMAPDKGLVRNKKPLFIAEDAFQTLENAYCYRDRVLEREGTSFLGQLQRSFSSINFFLSEASPWTFNILTVNGYVSTANNANPGQITTKYPHALTTGDKIILTGVVGATGYNNVTFTITVVDSLSFTVGANAAGFGSYVSGGYWISNRLLSAASTVTEPNAQVVPTSFILVSNGVTYTDEGNGTITSSTPGNSGHINYTTGSVTLTTTIGAGHASVLSFGYYPLLPNQNIVQRETSAINDEQTIWFDTKYAYVWEGTSFSEFIPGTVWNATDSDFFWCYNYRGTAASNKIMFVTDFLSSSDNPMRYTDGNTWTNFAPLITASNTLFSCRILIAYYGRLLALNTWEGSTSGGYAGATNFQSRCRFSQRGNPLQSDAWQVDIFGKGGIADAPTTEAIIGAYFLKNTLVVDFESSTWQLRYVGEYGEPFIWERVSVDFGSQSTFSGVVFDNFRLSIGDKAITKGNSIGVNRADLDIPDQVFSFQNENSGVERIQGVRDYRKELVFWNYPDVNDEAAPAVAVTFPNKVLVYNYRNNTFAIFRDSITAFGTFQSNSSITWDNTNIYWDSENVTWDDEEIQSLFPLIVCGNQQGFVSCYGYPSPASQISPAAQDQPTLSITGITLTASLITITSPNHNLQNKEIIYLNNLLFLDSSTFAPLTSTLNNSIFQVQVVSVNTFTIAKWDFDTQSYAQNFSFTPVTTALYVGGGYITLFPKINIITKDINIYQNQGAQTKLSFIDFIMQPTNNSSVSIILNTNASFSTNGNLLFGNRTLSTGLTQPFYPLGSSYSNFRFYSTLAAQYFNIQITYDDNLMNTLLTHQSEVLLLGMTAWVRPGGRLTF